MTGRFMDFKAWFDTELRKYPMIAKSNPLSLNELCYVLRLSGADYSVNWRTKTGFCSIPSVREAFVPSHDLAMKVKLEGYDEDFQNGTVYRSVTVRVVSSPALRDTVEKAVAYWKPELDRICTLLGCCELLAGLAEESTELAQAALKLRRTLDKRNPTPVSMAEASDKLNEEFADVVLCAAALGIDEEGIERYVRQKAARWIDRIEEGENDG